MSCPASVVGQFLWRGDPPERQDRELGQVRGSGGPGVQPAGKGIDLRRSGHYLWCPQLQTRRQVVVTLPGAVLPGGFAITAREFTVTSRLA